MKIALGSNRPAKIAAVQACVEKIAPLNQRWRGAEIIARPVETGVPGMPLTDMDLMRGARNRAVALRALLESELSPADLYLGLEGGFHSLEFEGAWHTYLRGWAYATDGTRESFGQAPSIRVPDAIARRVIEGGLELGPVMDEVAQESDVRSRQGAWGVLSRDLLTRAMSFEAALVAALAPFYNPQLYS